MKKMKLVLPMAALIFVIVASAFSIKKHTAPKTTSLYWYTVNYDASHPNGIILSESDFYTQDEKTNVNSPCDPGAVKDCLRGFASELTSFPNTTSGIDQIKKP